MKRIVEKSPTNRVKKVLLFLFVCALHGVLAWFLLTTSRVTRVATQLGGLELLVIAPAQESPSTRKSQEAAPRAVGQTAPHRVFNSTKNTDSDTQSNAITPPVAWDAEILRAGRAVSGIDSKNPTKDFGFPKRPPTTADYPQFDWDYARTHRVESIPEGGVIIHLNDNCVLVLNPLPFAFCSPFKGEANGELFKHMRDPATSSEPQLP